MMKSHLILRLHRIILIAALFLAASCKEDDTSVQLKAPQTLTAIPSETSLLIEWGGVDEAAAYELEARSDDYAFSTRVEDTRYELTGLEAYTEYEVRIRALVVSGMERMGAVQTPRQDDRRRIRRRQRHGRRSLPNRTAVATGPAGTMRQRTDGRLFRTGRPLPADGRSRSFRL